MELKRALQLRPALSQNTTQADIKNEKDVALAPSEAFRLLDLPRELIGQVFENVPRSGLGRLEQVCNLMKDLVRPAYKHAVGPRPWQREVNGIDYRALAVAQGEMQQTLRSEAENQRDDPSLKWSAEFVMSRLTNNDYLKLDGDLVVCAEKALCVLQKSPARGSSEWNEAVATALMAQRRFAEAGPYFKNLTAGETPLPPRTL
ncbi:MAG: F-box domain-containing protein, partial [Cytophagaceae bacterium]